MFFFVFKSVIIIYVSFLVCKVAISYLRAIGIRLIYVFAWNTKYFITNHGFTRIQWDV